ncbi:alpha/beta fold hydrolase [Acidithiobacillus sp. M4-SHS-6]|uniref:alpha/beta fold hydrolase n=1 Tax=Acidithiobacillus sp. M4-SHS-6 TaxID=3383024 RepID=UPI0039BDA99C
MSWFREQAGQGPTLLLLHGWGMESRVFAGWLALLEPCLTCVTYDLPGHGRSPCTATGMHWPDMLQQLQDMLSREATPPILLGWSLGGLLALGLALSQPGLLKGLVLMASSPSFRQRADWSAGIPAATLEDFGQRLETDPQGTRKRFLALQVLGDPQGRRALDGMTAWPNPDPACLADGLRLLQEVDLRDALDSLTLPVQIIHGLQDRIVPPEAGFYLHQHIAGSQLNMVEQAGHAPFLSRPELCRDALLECWT